MPNYKGRGGQGRTFCRWHYQGVPTRMLGKRWWVKGCQKCAEKLAAGLVGPEDELENLEGNKAFRKIMTDDTNAAMAKREAEAK